jgi:hypothetical protein
MISSLSKTSKQVAGPNTIIVIGIAKGTWKMTSLAVFETPDLVHFQLRET